MNRTADQIIAANNAMLASHPDIKNWDDIHAHTIAMRLGKCDICNAMAHAKDGLETPCDDCKADAGVDCSWNCSTNWA
jgi:hypothetical protein